MFNGAFRDLGRLVASALAEQSPGAAEEGEGGRPRPRAGAGNAGAGRSRSSPAGFHGHGRPIIIMSTPGGGFAGAPIESLFEEHAGPHGFIGGSSHGFVGPGGGLFMGPGGPGGGMMMGPGVSDADAGLMGQMMRAAVEQMFQNVAQEGAEDSQRAPPANESTRDALPRVVVTKEDMLDETNSTCAICFEEYRPGMRATRMFCGHLFCTTCIREWLRNANTCPVCRYELATDASREFERSRKERMSERTVRLRRGELSALRVPELRRLMVALAVSSDGCVEKSDLIKRLEDTKGIELTDDRPDILYDEDELRALGLPLLRTLMERYRLPLAPEEFDEEAERDEAIRRFEAAGRLGARSVAPAAAAALPAPPAAPLPAMLKVPPKLRTPTSSTGAEAVAPEAPPISDAARSTSSAATSGLRSMARAALRRPRSPSAAAAAASPMEGHRRPPGRTAAAPELATQRSPTSVRIRPSILRRRRGPAGSPTAGDEGPAAPP